MFPEPADEASSVGLEVETGYTNQHCRTEPNIHGQTDWEYNTLVDGLSLTSLIPTIAKIYGLPPFGLDLFSTLLPHGHGGFEAAYGAPAVYLTSARRLGAGVVFIGGS